jgi:hypothetical protein
MTAGVVCGVGVTQHHQENAMRFTIVLFALAGLALMGTQLSAQDAGKPKRERAERRTAPDSGKDADRLRERIEKLRNELRRERGERAAPRGERAERGRKGMREGKRMNPGKQMKRGKRGGMMPGKRMRPGRRGGFAPGKRMRPGKRMFERRKEMRRRGGRR